MKNARGASHADVGSSPNDGTTRDCAALGCGQKVFEYSLFCPACWRLMSSDLHKLIAKYHRPGRRPSKVLTGWIQRAIDELAYIRLNGHRPPSSGSFMWDDEPAAAALDVGSLFDDEEKK